jgi:hypothetical protein
MDPYTSGGSVKGKIKRKERDSLTPSPLWLFHYLFPVPLFPRSQGVTQGWESEQFVCDTCMWADPKYVAVYDEHLPRCVR